MMISDSDMLDGINAVLAKPLQTIECTSICKKRIMSGRP